MQIEESGVGRSAFPERSRPLLVHHVAKRLGISRRMVRHLASTGRLAARKAGVKIWNFRAVDVDQFRESREARDV